MSKEEIIGMAKAKVNRIDAELEALARASEAGEMPWHKCAMKVCMLVARRETIIAQMRTALSGPARGKSETIRIELKRP